MSDADTIRDREPVGVVVTDSPRLGYGDYVLVTESERDALVAENQRMRDELLWFYTTGIGQLVHFNITDQERIRRANVALSFIEHALTPDVEDEGITPIETGPLLGRDRRRNGEATQTTERAEES